MSLVILRENKQPCIIIVIFIVLRSSLCNLCTYHAVVGSSLRVVPPLFKGSTNYEIIMVLTIHSRSNSRINLTNIRIENNQN